MTPRTSAVLLAAGALVLAALLSCAGGSTGDGTAGSPATGGDAASGGGTSTTPTGGTGADGAGGTGGMGGAAGSGGGANLDIGSECFDDSDCASGLCRAVLLDTNTKVCVTPCTAQADCPAGQPFFCEPITAGSTDGYCIPRSPAHCLSCETDDECGSLSEVCIIAPGDEDLACHVDCSIAGDAACPGEYDCEQVMVGTELRDLCMPPIDTCLDATGGFCDRVAIPQICERINAAGTCVGQRACLAAAQRFDSCDAPAPQCKPTCSTQDPAGCDQIFCPEATDDPDNCGTCGYICPGYGQATANVTCDGTNCGFSCSGENYDVDNQETTGCEIVDVPTGNHTQAAAIYLGSMPCNDGSSNPNISGNLPSDARVHENPAVSGFVTNTGSAPDWYRIFGDGGLCQNDISLTLQVSGSGSLACYQLWFYNSDGNYSCSTNSSGSCTISQGSGSYAENSDIFLVVQKTCTPATPASVTYTVTGHL